MPLLIKTSEEIQQTFEAKLTIETSNDDGRTREIEYAIWCESDETARQLMHRFYQLKGENSATFNHNPAEFTLRRLRTTL